MVPLILCQPLCNLIYPICRSIGRWRSPADDAIAHKSWLTLADATGPVGIIRTLETRVVKSHGIGSTVAFFSVLVPYLKVFALFAPAVDVVFGGVKALTAPIAIDELPSLALAGIQETIMRVHIP